MARRLYIPKKVIESISSHVDQSIDQAIEGFWSANEDEDTLTGHLGACLRTGSHRVEVEREQKEEIFGTWRWSIDYAKFRGRGRQSTESVIGADGILELKLEFGQRTDTKSMLFQSKLDWSNDADLVNQSLLLSTWREAAIIINYTPTSFEVFSIDDVISSRGNKSEAKNDIDLKNAINEFFLQCEIGNTDLTYDARSRRLAWRSDTGIIVATQFSIPNRIRVNVKAPKYSDDFRYDKMISLQEIHTHRMQVDYEEIFYPLLSHQKVEPKKQKKVMSLSYHPDRFSAYDNLFQDIANKRMQEINSAFEKIKVKK